MRTKTLLALLLTGLLTLAVACGGDDDDASSGGSSSGSGTSGDGEATATSEPASEATAAGGGTASGAGSDADTVGLVTVGDDTWMIVGEFCSFEAVPDTVVEVVELTGHAASDDSILISIEFDPRDAGLVMTVSNGGDVDWSADNASFTVSVGEPLIRGDGMFTGGGNSVAGSFEVRC